ncbi:MAG: glycosyltransferase family 2 protein [bacterium]
MCEYNEGLVSIIMPVYNCEDYILETINSILNQSYTNWELIIINDHSTDNTEQIIKQINNDKIQYYKLEQNSGTAIARNKAISLSKGKFIAFLDADDLWLEDKLMKQISFMIKNDYHFTSTLYQRMDENGEKLNWISKHFKVRDYNLLLKRCPGNSTVIYNQEVLGKTYIENIKKRNDYVMWLKIIKKSRNIYELNEVLSFYRIRNDSLSNNKSKLIKYQWQAYRQIEKLSFLKSLYILAIHIFRGIFKIK